MHLIMITVTGLFCVAGLVLVARRTSHRGLRRLCLFGCGVILAGLTITAAVALRHGLTPEAAVTRWCDRHLSPAIEALENYRSKFGRYPADYGVVMKALPAGEPYDWGSWPTQNGSAMQIEYVCVGDGDSYMLGVIGHYAAWGGLFGMIVRHWSVLYTTSPEDAVSSLPDETKWDLGGFFDDYVGTWGRWSVWKDRSGQVPYSDEPWIPWWWPFG